MPQSRKQPNSLPIHIKMTMKLKIKIIGPKVYDVGYRVFLLKHAMNMTLPGLSTYNWKEGGQQEVIALVKGDEARIKAFLKTYEGRYPTWIRDAFQASTGRCQSDKGTTRDALSLLPSQEEARAKGW